MQTIRGKRNVRIIGGLETDLELDFNKTIREILEWQKYAIFLLTIKNTLYTK